MGLYFMRSSSSFDKDDWDKNFSINLSTKAPFIKVEQINEMVRVSPDPTKFTVEMVKQVGNHLVLKLIYADATNYEGKKILVFKNATYMDIVKKNKGVIDPHFSKNGEFISPYARFEPTESGWRMALQFCKLLDYE